jgi:2-oxoglutarate dehydrogenase E1 component
VSDSSKTSEFTGDNLAFIEQLYAQYKEDPDSVDPSWKPLFDEYFDDAGGGNGRAPSFEPSSIFSPSGAARAGAAPDQGGIAVYFDKAHDTRIRALERTEGFAARVEAMVRAYRLHGHLVADIDPLERPRPPAPPELDPSLYGFTEADLDTEVRCEPLFGPDETKTLRQVLDRLRELYSGSIGVEYQNIPDNRPRAWLRKQIEKHGYADVGDADDKKHILQRLIQADSFETFLHKKYVGAKRFGVTGGDSLIPMLAFMLEEAGAHDVDQVIFGMAHRGRLNVLHNIMGKPEDAMLSEFEKTPEPERYVGSSDVKYHMGYSSDFTTRAGETIHMSLCFNPSHLEYVNPVVLGRTRAKQQRRGLAEAKGKILPVLMHGDAAFAGQGIAAETLNLARLDGFSVGGSIHIVINNQIGFTTEPVEGRSTTYATDIAKMMEVPIFHVNADDPEACVRVIKLAVRYRQMFGEDVIIDLVCYRQHGHNEGDEPRYTQPVMYDRIDSKDHVREIYRDQLLDEDVISEDDHDNWWDERMATYGETFEKVHSEPKKKHVSSGAGIWEPYEGGDMGDSLDVDTTVERERLEELGLQLADAPDDFNTHRTIRRLLKTRKQMAEGDKSLDWGMGEALAFASLVTEGYPVRMSGQDCVRGTFSHRHAALFDTETGDEYWPTRHLSDDQADFEIYNSMLSEAAVLGYEYGYSLDYPDGLTLWEAQFGDFANGAQVIIDQFINSGEDKWKRLSGLTMLLPHGYEGQGPEHSSARLERFLQLCAEDNMFVCNLTTPGQYFHALRRQVLNPYRKPLIIMSPKSLLRHKLATSELEELSDGGFQPVIPEHDERVDADSVERVLMCSGKVYYDLYQYREEQEAFDTALVRVEQVYPLDTEALEEAVAPYASAELCWVQEEPKNMGAWSFMFPYLLETFGYDTPPVYIGRRASASPATGSPESHDLEQSLLIRQAFGHDQE